MTKTKKWILTIAILLFIFLVARRVHAEVQENRLVEAQIQASIMTENERIAQIEAMSIPELITLLGGKNAPIIANVARCESGFNPKAINYDDGAKGSHSYGLMQFKIPTWQHFTKMMGEDLNMESAYDQIRVSNFMISKGYGFHWSCYQRLYS